MEEFQCLKRRSICKVRLGCYFNHGHTVILHIMSSLFCNALQLHNASRFVSLCVCVMVHSHIKDDNKNTNVGLPKESSGKGRIPWWSLNLIVSWLRLVVICLFLGMCKHWPPPTWTAEPLNEPSFNSQQKQPKFTADSHVASKVIAVIQASSRRVVSFNSMAAAHVPRCHSGQLVMSQLKGLALHVLDVQNGQTEPCSQEFNFWSRWNCFIDRRISQEKCRVVNYPAVHITDIDLHSTEGKWNSLMTCNFQV